MVSTLFKVENSYLLEKWETLADLKFDIYTFFVAKRGTCHFVCGFVVFKNDYRVFKNVCNDLIFGQILYTGFLN